MKLLIIKQILLTVPWEMYTERYGEYAFGC